MSALNKKLLKKPIEIEQKEEELTQYNNLAELSYKAKGLSVPQNLDWEVKKFLAQYDPSKGPIEKKVTTDGTPSNAPHRPARPAPTTA